MFKFLRKYNKLILAVGGTLLMIVFLIPQAIQGLSQRAAASKATQASIGSDQISASELREAQIQLQLLDRGNGAVLQGVGKIDSPWHWYLLVREAEQAGCIGAPVLIDPVQLAAVRQATGMGVAQIQATEANLRGVQLMLNLYMTSGQLSDQRLRRKASDLFSEVGAQTVIIEASADDLDWTPTDAEIQTQFAAHAETDPNDSEAKFGYRLPDRVRVETLTVPADAIRATIEGTDAMSGVELRKHWRSYAGLAGKRGFPELPTTPTADIPDVIGEDLLRTLVERKADDIERYATNALRMRVRTLKPDEGYYLLSPTWAADRLAFPELATSIQERFGVALPTYQSHADWLAMDDLDALEGIGTATTDKFPPIPLGLSNLAAISKELGGSTMIALQSGIAGPALREVDSTLHLFRITETDAARAPASADEVRAEVISDLRRMRDFEALSRRVAEIEEEAARSGLLAIALANDTIVQPETRFTRLDIVRMFSQPRTDQPPAPLASPLPVVGPDDAAVSRLIEFGMALPQDQPLDEMDESSRVFVLPSEKRLAIVVGRVTSLSPLTEDRFRLMIDSARQLVVSEELGNSLAEAFSFDALSARHDFTILRTGGEEDAETAPDAETETATASAE